MVFLWFSYHPHMVTMALTNIHQRQVFTAAGALAARLEGASCRKAEASQDAVGAVGSTRPVKRWKSPEISRLMGEQTPGFRLILYI